MGDDEDPKSRKKNRSISITETSRQWTNVEKENSDDTAIKLGKTSGLIVGSLLRVWAEVSRINYFSSQPLDIITLGQSIRRRSIGLPSKEYSIECFVPTELRNKSVEDLFAEQFPVKVTSLLNEDQHWGCFYMFPELYADVYSPVVCIRDIEDVPELLGGELTRDMVTACLSYLKRTPILGDFVYIKLDISSKFLINIQVLQHYKYLVYLDLSSNLLTELSVLSNLLYLQYLSVAFNRLHTVLEYETPQWFLTEVHYKFNSVKRIRDLSMFWSITILDLSHNNIKGIAGLETLRYLRRLDLSFNHIQRLENLNHLRLLWLDVSYNNISSFEFGLEAGLWTLLHLEYLNLNENNLTSMKMFSRCTRLRELHARNNRLSMLLELAVYMRQMRRLIILDLRANPICSTEGYKDVVINTFPVLLSLDAEELNPVEQRTSLMEMTPDVVSFATRRLLRLMYVEQLARARVPPPVPPADTTEVPLVVLVGYEAVGKGTLARRLASECSAHVELAISHTTAPYHSPGHYKEVTRGKFDEMMLSGDFLTYTEMDGESYGLSRKEAFIRDGKVRIACMDLPGALMLKLRGRRPYLILASCLDKRALSIRQQFRKGARNWANEQRKSMEPPMERSTLQVLLSGRIIITGIINEILLCLPEEKEQSEFVVDSECSLMMDSEARQAANDYTKGVNLLTLLASSATSLEEACKRAHERSSQLEPSLYSLYKESQGTGEYTSYVNGQSSYQDKKSKKSDLPQPRTKDGKYPSISRPKSVDFSRYASSTWKGLSMVPDSAKSSKSVTFTSADAENQDIDPIGMLIEPPRPAKEQDEKGKVIRSISTRMPCPRGQSRQRDSVDDIDLWLAFLTETGIMRSSDITHQISDPPTRHNTKLDDPASILRQMDYYHTYITNPPCETLTTNIRDDYEGIHRKLPGLFRDTYHLRNVEIESHSSTMALNNNIREEQLKTLENMVGVVSSICCGEDLHRADPSDPLARGPRTYSCLPEVTMDDPNEAFMKVKNIIRNIVNSQKLFKPMFDIDFASMKYYPTVEKRLSNICQQIAPQRLFY